MTSRFDTIAARLLTKHLYKQVFGDTHDLFGDGAPETVRALHVEQLLVRHPLHARQGERHRRVAQRGEERGGGGHVSILPSFEHMF